MIITTNILLRFQSQPTTQLETELVNCFCNTELRTATITKIKGLLIQTQLDTFVLLTLLKLTLDERKTLTKNLCTISQRSPMHRATHYLEHEDPGIIKRQKEPSKTNGESALCKEKLFAISFSPGSSSKYALFPFSRYLVWKTLSLIS